MNVTEIDAFRRDLLEWYDRHRRVLPWRCRPGEKADAYKIWLSEIMLQQTTVVTVAPYYEKFLAAWPAVSELAAAPSEQVMAAWAGLGYYARARNLHACAKAVTANFGGRFPDDERALLSLPGIGPYTSAAIRAIAFDKPAVVIDGNVERVAARYFAIETPLPEGKNDIRLRMAEVAEGREDRPGDFAQAMMDLGAVVCVPQKPRCALCPLARGCRAKALSREDALPARAAKAVKPERQGIAYYIRGRNGEIVLERRAGKGLLAGMAGLPTGEWGPGAPSHLPELAGRPEIRRAPRLIVRHVFTHFNLKLSGYVLNLDEADLARLLNAPHYFLHAERDILEVGLPTVFKKMARLAMQGGDAAAGNMDLAGQDTAGENIG